MVILEMSSINAVNFLSGQYVKPEENLRVCRPTVPKFYALIVAKDCIRPGRGHPAIAEDVDNDTRESLEVDGTDFGIVIYELCSMNDVNFLPGHYSLAML